MGDNEILLGEVITSTDIIAWIRGAEFQIHSGDAGESDDEVNIQNQNNEQYVPHGDLNPQHTMSVFNRMQAVFQYNTSRELMNQYRSTREQLAEMESSEEAISNAFEIETLSNAETLSLVSSTWYLETDYTPSTNSELTSTDSEVHLTSTSPINNADLLIRESITKSPIENMASNDIEPENNILDINQQESRENLPYPLQDNMLLRACILDINSVPMTALMSHVTNQMLPLMFNREEIVILRHFLRYRIRLAIEEINQRLEALTIDQNNMVTSDNTTTVAENSNGDEYDEEIVSSWDFSLSGEDEESSPERDYNDSEQFVSDSNLESETISEYLEESQERLSDSDHEESATQREYLEERQELVSQNDQESVTGREFLEESHELVSDNDQESIRHAQHSRSANTTPDISYVCKDNSDNSQSSIINELPDVSHQSSKHGASRHILPTNEDWEKGGRTLQAINIMNEMVKLTSEQRRKLLQKKIHLLSVEEYNAVDQFISSAEDYGQAHQGFWRRLCTQLVKSRAKTRTSS